ncbi:hypothetical protein [Spongiimicrobium sp. 3-5]|uniref:hypothetical protein n=1 Tax=Spongiimicrobium sp. 3-5 TaxID=3332596 RepID=UPI00397F87C0
MKCPYFFLLPFLCLFIISCSKDEESSSKDEEKTSDDPKSEVYFTVKTACEDDSSAMDNWIIVHGEDGQLLDYKTYETEEVLTFETSEEEIPAKFTVTTLEVREIQGFPSHILESVTEVTKGSIWDNTCTVSPEPISNPTLGKFNLSVNNVPFQPVFYGFNISDGIGISDARFNTVSNGGFTDFEEQIDIKQNGDDYLISIFDGNGDFKYHFLDEYTNGANISLDYSEFASYDSYLEFDVPPYERLFFTTTGYEDNSEKQYTMYTVLAPGFYSNPVDILKPGYLDRFSTYNIILIIDVLDGYTYSYTHLGPKPEAINIPEKPMFTIQNTDIHNFEFSTDLEDYISKSIGWSYSAEDPISDGTNTYWSVRSVKGYNPVIGDLPEDLLQKYPQIHIQDLKYKHSVFRLNEEESIDFND